MLFALLALLFALGSAGMSYRELLRARRSASFACELFARAKSGVLLSSVVGEPEAVELARAALTASSREHAVAALNELSFDVAGGGARAVAVPRSAARIALAAGTCAAVFEMARTLSVGPALTWVVAAFALGALGALACGLLGRAAQAHESARREAYSRLTRLVLRRFDGADVPSAEEGNEELRAPPGHAARTVGEVDPDRRAR
jgi:hypothetical protein